MSKGDDFIRENEKLIRATVKNFWPENTFQVSKIAAKSKKNRAVLRKRGISASERNAALGTSWRRGMDKVKSLACVYEQLRLRLAIFVALYPKLKALSGYDPTAADTGWHFVTRALDKHRVPAAGLKKVDPRKYIRPLTDAFRKLKVVHHRFGLPPWGDPGLMLVHARPWRYRWR